MLAARVFLFTIPCLAPVLAQSPPQSANRAVPSTTTLLRPSLTSRILGMVAPAEPAQLTQKQRFRQYVLATIGPFPLIGEAVGAGLSQWQNTPKEWGQGWNAYGQRFGNNLAYNGVRQTISYGTSVMFHEDGRYFASDQTGTWPRVKHALVSTFTSRRPDGRQTFSFSNTSGVIGASAIASIWGPPSWKGIDNIATNAGISFASTAAFNVIREFFPRPQRKPQP